MVVDDEAVSGDSNALKPLTDESFGFVGEVRLEVVAHAAGNEAVGVFLLYLFQVVVLEAVDKFLHDDGCRHLCIVHVGEEYLGRVETVGEKRRHHLHLIAEEQSPEMAVCVDDGHGLNCFSISPSSGHR